MTKPPASSTSPTGKAAANGAAPSAKAGRLATRANEADQRLTLASPIRRALNKVFPDHWSFMLGEVALYSFVILLLTGTYLTLFFDPSMAETKYSGSYDPLRGVEMSRAYSTTLDLSFDIRGGLIIRQIHHWAALIFVAAIMVHMLRVFFTGAFRRPRELNWLIGIGLLLLSLVEGFAGYSLPDDLLSGTGLRIASGIILSIPVIGTWLYFLVFNGDFPGTEILGRLYILHVLVIPALLLALIALHLGLVVKQKHSQYPGAGRTEKNVKGVRVMPLFAAKGGGLFMFVFGVTALLGGLSQVNPIWLYGPYAPADVSAGSQPDFYMWFLEGDTRIWPSWEFRGLGYTIPAVFFPTVVVPGLVFTIAAIYPWIEARLTKDRALHNLLQRPRDVPVRTALGAMALTWFLWMTVLGANDVWAKVFDISLNATIWIGRIGMLLLPPLAYWVAYRVSLGLERHDREVLEHGVETGIIKRLPTGEFIEIHQPLGPVDEHGHGQLEYAGAPVPKKVNKLGSTGRAIRGFFSPVEEPSEVAAVTGGNGDRAGQRELASQQQPE
ncbi:MAG: ubiquinol-cytochrome c reductase cytochrome b subunit [Actinobacteria bacterium]|nr:ubiquinol-cytochrome c reductase cytochrome b subunit [Actinomycetota bacterium]MBI3688056.1 ubiquinol-cytochrome c reductase cytochrome b subunit [Actinomycetota bacterium]